MDTFATGTESVFARAISAEIRARLAAERITGRQFAKAAGFTSQNYLAIRLRDERPFTLDDLERVCRYFGEDVPAFVQAAYQNHDERIWTQLMAMSEAGDRPDLAIAAHEEGASIVGEQEESDTP
jgi:transcriptional regulator with XRE-family HTH domain